MKTALGHGEQYVFHSIRKTVDTPMENAGITDGIAADILGHKKPP
jgi:integrase